MGRSALFTRFFAFWCIFLISTTSSNYLQDFLAWKWWVGGLVMIMIEIIGFLANSMSLVVLLRPKIRETSFNQLLAVLCIVDTFFIFCNTFSCIHALGVKNGKLRYLTQKWMHFFSKDSLFDFAVSISDSFKTVRGIMDAFGQVAMCASVLLIVALTCERHFAIRSPHRVSIQYFLGTKSRQVR